MEKVIVILTPDHANCVVCNVAFVWDSQKLREMYHNHKITFTVGLFCVHFTRIPYFAKNSVAFQFFVKLDNKLDPYSYIPRDDVPVYSAHNCYLKNKCYSFLWNTSPFQFSVSPSPVWYLDNRNKFYRL